MSKIYDLYSSDQRKIDNWRRRIIGYEKMKRDNQREMHKLRKQRDLYKKIINNAIQYIKDSCYYLELENYSNMTSEEVKELLQILDKGGKND